MMETDGFPPRSWQLHYPTRASKLDLMSFIARYGEVDIGTVAGHFRLTETGAKVKLWRLTKQNLLETDPESRNPKTWQLTRYGRRHLDYLREAEDYGGTKGLLIRNLTAEVARLRAECEHWRSLVEDGEGIFQEAVDVANENVALRRTCDELRADNSRLRAQVDTYQRALLAKAGSKP